MLQAASVTLPVFAPSSVSRQSNSATASGYIAVSTGDVGPTEGLQQDGGWQMESSGANDTMDFDLLAEYLLDDTPNGAAGVPFDFNVNASANSANAPAIVVSPEQSEDGVMPPVAEGAAVAAAAPAPVQPHVQMQMIQQQHPASAQPLAPPPVAMAPPPVASQYSPPSVQPHVQSAFSAHSGGHIALVPAIAPAQGMAVPSLAPNQVPQQITATKRRKLDDAALPSMAHQMPPVLNDPIAVAAALQGRGRKKSQAQIDRRRERNRILARRTRLRKKFFFESLQKEVMDLQRENSALKDIVRGQLSNDEGKRLLDECDAAEKLPSAVMEACGEQGSDMDQQDFNLVKSIQQSQHCFVITDPSLQDNPIVFASDDFLSLTGYSREDVLGRNCRFLQGTNTSEAKVAEIRKGISSGGDVSVTLVNYTADGTPFWNKLFIAALRDAQNNIVNFIGVIVKVASPEPDDPEHGVKLPGESNDGVDVDDFVSSGDVASAAAGASSAMDGSHDDGATYVDDIGP